MNSRAICRTALMLLGATLAVALGGCAGQRIHETGDPQRAVSLSGSWAFTSADAKTPELTPSQDSGWRSIEVPANWYLQGHDEAGVAWYRRHFSAPEAWREQRVHLRFEGVDYAAEVWLNGERLGEHVGYFQPFEFELTGKLRFDAENTLDVRVDSPLEAPGAEWSLNKTLIKGIFSHHDTRPGGAWSDRGQERNTGGIWAPVQLRATGQAAVSALRVTPSVDADSRRAAAQVALQVHHAGDQPLVVELDLSLRPHNFIGLTAHHQRQQLVLQPGDNTLQLNIPEADYRLWSIWERGQPNLYRYRARLSAAGEVLDSREAVFGFRSIRVDRDSMTWYLNGERLFLRGTNYIASQWLSEMSPASYRRDLELMRDANINAVRVHAHVTGRDFYRQADEAGVLVWQDFPLQWGYVDSEAFAADAERQVDDMVGLLYNHPSVIAWSLHNEPPWDAFWMKWKYPSYDPEQNRALDQRLFTRLQQHADGRYKHLTSATAEHPWLGWYSGHWLDYGKPTEAALITEFGAQALPAKAQLEQIVGADKLWPQSDEDWALWTYHNFQPHETFEIAKVPKGESTEELIANTQHYQARLIAFAAEAYRRQRYAPVGGIFQFMFVEDWPSMNWGVVDYWRNTKPGYEALRRAFQPLLPSIAWAKPEYARGEPVEMSLWVVNDLPRAFAGARLHHDLRRADGQRLASGQRPVAIEADSARQWQTLREHDLAPGRYRLSLRLVGADGSALGNNHYDFVVRDEEAAE